ncbi:MAG: hypothetical protein ACJA2H_001318, partial [Nitriliruptoraceae bacterium]
GIDREVDEARWGAVTEASAMLSYDTDRELLLEAMEAMADHTALPTSQRSAAAER